MKEKFSSVISALKPTKRKTVVLLAVLLTGGLLAGFMGAGNGARRSGSNTQQSEAVRTVTLERSDLASTVSATGTVYSTSATEIYSNLSYPVKTVYVAVGDRVNEGDVLAELDSDSLQSDISQKQASVWASQSSAQQSLTTAQQDLDIYQKNLENNYDTGILNAESSVESAELELQNAELELQNAELEVQSAELDIQSAVNEVATARRNYLDAINDAGDYEETGASDSQIRSLRDIVNAKETAAEKARTNLEKVQTNLEKSRTNLEKAQANLNKANATLEATKESASDTVATYQNKVTTAQVSNNFNDQYISIQKMQGDLEKCVITAPVSGTVTVVNAVEGGSGNGMLFVIQDTDHLKVVTNIKEYDIDSVMIGDQVVIKADATGNQEFSGTLSKIAPTSTLTVSGTASASTDAEFESEVTVSPGAQGLRIGMNTRLSIITEEKKNVFSVPYEAVGTGPDGSAYIYVMNTDENGGASYERVTVETGMETNLYVEISGEALREGMQVVRSVQSVAESGTQPDQADSAPNTDDGAEAPTSEGGSGFESDSAAGTAGALEDTLDGEESK